MCVEAWVPLPRANLVVSMLRADTTTHYIDSDNHPQPCCIHHQGPTSKAHVPLLDCLGSFSVSLETCNTHPAT